MNLGGLKINMEHKQKKNDIMEILRDDAPQINPCVNLEDIKDDIWESITYLKRARMQIGWTIAELSRKSGVSVGVISDLENSKGKVPSLANFIAITRTLGMSKEFVLGLILDYKICNKSSEGGNCKSIINNLQEFGIHDKESIDFIMNTINFVKNRKKNKTIE